MSEINTCDLANERIEFLEGENAILEAENALLAARVEELDNDLTSVVEIATTAVDMVAEELANVRSQRRFALQALAAIQAYEGDDVEVPGLIAQAALRDWIDFED